MFKKQFDGPYDCPATGFRERCRKDKCPEWVEIGFQHPQTGEQAQQKGCARGAVPVLLVKVAQEIHQLAGAIESARNQGVKDAQTIGSGMVEAANELAAMARELASVPRLVGDNVVALPGAREDGG